MILMRYRLSAIFFNLAPILKQLSRSDLGQHTQGQLTLSQMTQIAVVLAATKLFSLK